MSKCHFSLAFLIFSTFSIGVFAQTPVSPSKNDSDVVKISTSLIQVDATVTDKKGNTVTDLRPEDFEVFENGKLQDITNFSFIKLASETINSEKVADQPKTKDPIPLPPVNLRANQVRRTYALVVDDLGLSFENSFFVKESLRKFVNEQMQPGDLVAILRVSRGIGALQSFTSDKRLLLAAVNKIRWNPVSRIGLSSFDPIVSSMKEQLSNIKRSDGSVKTVEGIAQENESDARFRETFQKNYAHGTLAALNYVIQGMRELPGRKSLMLFSEGFSTFDYSEVNKIPRPNEVYERLRGVAELANRSSVIIYTLDPRGLTIPGDIATAADDVGSPSAGNKLKIRGDTIRDTQNSLRFLADETGGIAYVDQNNLNRGIEKVLEDQRGYYLIGYQPDEETFDPKKNKFNDLDIRLKRSDLKIRYRSGFFGVTDEKFRQTNKTPQQQLAAALVLPFGANEVNLDLYSIFYNDDQNRNFIRSFVYIDPKDLQFKQTANNLYTAEFEVAAMIFDSNGAAAGNGIYTQNLKFNSEQFAVVQKKGILYNLSVPIVKPGAYQFRVALRDTSTGKIGAASQFIELPNISKKQFTLSSLMLKSYSLDEWKRVSFGQETNTNSSNKATLLDTVSREFRRGSVFTYAFVIYNARVDAQKQPQLQIQTRLYREGKVVLEGEPTPLALGAQKDLQRIEIVDAVTLGTDLEPGEYILQIIVSDQLAKEKKRYATQAVDFEIVR